MKQVLLRKNNLFVQEMPNPVPMEHRIIVAVRYSFISSGTEGATIAASRESLIKKISKKPQELAHKVIATSKEHGFYGTLSLIQEKLDKAIPLGYSCSGQVVAVGDKVNNFKIGDFVACAGSAYAYHAEFVNIPENLAVKISSDRFLKEASITTIGAIALQGVRRAAVQLGETVAVVGLGLIGLITVQLLKRAGCRVIGIDKIDDRLIQATSMGADIVFNVADPAMMQSILFATQHYGVDATIVTAASSTGSVIQTSMEITRKKGKVVLVGDVKIDFDRAPFYEKEIDFLISCSYGPGRYDDSYEVRGIDYPYAYVRWTENRNMHIVVDMIEREALNIRGLISQEFAVTNIDQAYKSLQDATATGVVIAYNHDRLFEFERDRHLEADEGQVVCYAPIQHQIAVGIIGAGGFARTKLLPMLRSMSKVVIRSIIDLDTVTCINLARQYGAVHVGNSHYKITVDEGVHAVIISTPHYIHAEQALDCLRAGKAVFCEKPAAVNMEQLTKIREFLSMHPESLYCVDFNRPFSPFMKKIKEKIRNRLQPVVIHYRMNVQFIPLGHWIQSDEHGGRIIGEACHIFDLFSFLTDALPVSVGVSALNTHVPYLATDNVSIQIRMDDGSLCTLLYTAMGSSALNKEYMELFVDGTTIIMDDFIELKGYGLPASFDERVTRQDKGHQALLEEFFHAARTSPIHAPVPFNRILSATEVSIIATELARQGGGFADLGVKSY